MTVLHDRLAMAGEGPLTRTARALNRHAALALCLAVGCAPSVLVGLFVAPTPLGTVLYVLGLAPVAPALSAGLYAVRGWRRDPDGGTVRPFLRGLTVNARDVLRWWLPALAVVAVLAVDVRWSQALAAGPVLRAGGLALGLVVALWAGHALVVSSYFAFRTRDLVRIAAVELFLSWRVTLAFLSLLVVAAFAVTVAGDGALLLLVWAFVVFLELVSRPLVRHVTDQFTKESA